MKQVNPEVEVQVLEKEITPYIKKTATLVITDKKTMEKASEVRTQLKSYLKSVKEKKETVTKPLYAAYKAAMALFAPLESRIEDQLAVIDKAMIAYQTAEKKRADEEAAKIESRIGEGKGKLKFETAVDKIANIEKPEDKVTTESGGTQFFTYVVCEVEDITKVPVEYLEVNLAKVKTDEKAGKRIPGIKYTEEQRPKNMR